MNVKPYKDIIIYPVRDDIQYHKDGNKNMGKKQSQR
jgi:hypothetical protein